MSLLPFSFLAFWLLLLFVVVVVVSFVCYLPFLLVVVAF